MSEIVKCKKCGDTYFGFEDPAVITEDGIYHKECDPHYEDPILKIYKKYPDIPEVVLDALYQEDDIEELSYPWCVVSTTEDYEYTAKGFNDYDEMVEHVCEEDDGGSWSVEYIYNNGKPVKYRRVVKITLEIEEK